MATQKGNARNQIHAGSSNVEMHYIPSQDQISLLVDFSWFCAGSSYNGGSSKAGAQFSMVAPYVF
jgi:hypothetical protein